MKSRLLNQTFGQTARGLWLGQVGRDPRLITGQDLFPFKVTAVGHHLEFFGLNHCFGLLRHVGQLGPVVAHVGHFSGPQSDDAWCPPLFAHCSPPSLCLCHWWPWSGHRDRSVRSAGPAPQASSLRAFSDAPSPASTGRSCLPGRWLLSSADSCRSALVN